MKFSQIYNRLKQQNNRTGGRVPVASSQFAGLLKLGHEAEHLIWRCDDLILKVKRAVFRCLVQEVTIVHHDAAGVGHTPGAGVGTPVEPPHRSAILQVEVSHWIESIAAPLLPVQVPGAQTHQNRLQDSAQSLWTHPLVRAEELAKGVNGRGPRGRIGGMLYLLPLFLRQQIKCTALLPALAEQALKPSGEAWNGWQAGELGHVRELALEGRREAQRQSYTMTYLHPVEFHSFKKACAFKAAALVLQYVQSCALMQ